LIELRFFIGEAESPSLSSISEGGAGSNVAYFEVMREFSRLALSWVTLFFGLDKAYLRLGPKLPVVFNGMLES